MKIIDTPWLAIDIGSDRTRVAFQQSEREVLSVETLENEFDTVFHVSKNNHVVTLGRAALEHLESDPDGIVLLRSGQLKNDEPIVLPDGRCEVRPSQLYTAMLRHIREYCELRIFEGAPVQSCVMAVPHRNDLIRRAYRKVAIQAGFRQVLFRDAVLSAAATWRHVWGENCRYLMVCNLAASHVSFSLLRSNHGGFERIEHVTSSPTVGIDEIDRIILNAEQSASHQQETGSDADRLRLKNIRRECNFDREEKFRLNLAGRTRSVFSTHFLKAAQMVARHVEGAFLQYQDQCLETMGEKSIPIALVGGGTNIPVIFETIEKAAKGKVYWWGGAEEAIAVGTAMNMLPKQPRPNPTNEEDHFFQLYLKAETGNVQAQYYLGKSLELGHGVATSPEEAFDWYLLAAGSGYHKAKYRLANLIHRGLGTVHDESESLRLLRESADEGYNLSQYLLGAYYHETESGLPGEALEWLGKAASQNFAPAVEFIEKNFGRQSLPPIVKSVFAEDAGSGERGSEEHHSGETVFPAGETTPTPSDPPPDAEREKGRAASRKNIDSAFSLRISIGLGLSALIFLFGAIPLRFYRVENPVAEYGSLALFAVAGIAVPAAAFFLFRYSTAGEKPPGNVAPAEPS